MTSNRRDFLRTGRGRHGAGLTPAMFPPAIRKALAIPPHRRTGTIEDVEHVVILMQENRSFDHYFGTLAGVRGFGDRFPIPVPDAPGIAARRSGTSQRRHRARPHVVAPFRLDTARAVRAHARRGHAAHLARRAARLGRRQDERVAALQARPLDGLLHRGTTSPSSSRWPRPSRSATPTTARS